MVFKDLGHQTIGWNKFKQMSIMNINFFCPNKWHNVCITKNCWKLKAFWNYFNL